MLGGLIGLGGAEFRLPLLIGVFGFAALAAVIMNKAMSLIVVLSALPARLVSVPWSQVSPHWPVVVNLLAGSLVGAWLGATWATRMRSATLYRVLAVLLVLIAAALAWTHVGPTTALGLPTGWATLAGVAAGIGIGAVAALMGVAGGELLIPTIVLLYGVDIKIAGSLSLAVSLPTMLVAFARYSRDASFTVLAANRWFLLTMAAGSVTGTLLRRAAPGDSAEPGPGPAFGGVAADIRDQGVATSVVPDLFRVSETGQAVRTVVSVIGVRWGPRESGGPPSRLSSRTTSRMPSRCEGLLLLDIPFGSPIGMWPSPPGDSWDSRSWLGARKTGVPLSGSGC